MPSRKTRAVKLKQRRQRGLREALLGDQGYGFPARMRGYRLVGQAYGRLEPLFDRNDHQKVPLNVPFPDVDDFAWSAMSPDFWRRLGERLKENGNRRWVWQNTYHLKSAFQVQVFRDAETEQCLHIPVWRKDVSFRMLLTSFTLRMRVTNSKAEIEARKELVKALNGRQRRELLLTSGFEEEGKSGVRYLIRANRPTVAYRQVVLPDRMRDVRFLASLCLHPLAYYEDTYTGCMPPSDEMLVHLKMIRVGEHDYWRKCGQHGVEDPRSGF